MGRGGWAQRSRLGRRGAPDWAGGSYVITGVVRVSNEIDPSVAVTEGKGLFARHHGTF